MSEHFSTMQWHMPCRQSRRMAGCLPIPMQAANLNIHCCHGAIAFHDGCVLCRSGSIFFHALTCLGRHAIRFPRGELHCVPLFSIYWHRSDVCIFSRRGPSRSISDHLAKKYTHEIEKCTGNGRPSDGESC